MSLHENTDRTVTLTHAQIHALHDSFRFLQGPVTIRGAIPIRDGQPGTVMVTDTSARVWFVLADGSTGTDPEGLAA